MTSPGDRRALWSQLGRDSALALGTLLFASSATAAAAEVHVRMNGAQVDLEATAAPLPEVLDRLARLTGMKLVFEGAAPRPLVTISVHGRSPTQTVLAVLEGLGINYALLSDEYGIQVQQLLVTGAAAPSSSTTRRPSPSMRANRNMPLPPEPVEEPFEEEPPDEFGVPGNEAGLDPLSPGEPAEAPPEGPTSPAGMPQPYVPSPFLPAAPPTVQPIQPFPAPTPTAPPEPGPAPRGRPFSP